MAQQPSRRVVEWVKQQHAEVGETSRRSRKPRTKPQNSLEDILQNDPSASDGLLELTPLPESRDGSSAASDPGERDRNAAKRSLEAIDREDTLIFPSSIPLPGSPPRSPPPSPKQQPTRRKTAKPTREPPPRQPYGQILDRAADVFDHIKNGNIRKTPRVEKPCITLYDYCNDNTTWSREIGNADLISLSRDTPEGLNRRVLLVEDLSEGTIHSLGEAFGLTPEFFEEHLLNSGYSGAQYDDPLARSWKTAGLNRSYVSIQWFRPIYRRRPLFSNRDREDLLDLGRDGLEYKSGSSSISLRAETNIFRSEWDLRVAPHGAAKETWESGLVERASIWRKKPENMDYEIVVVLLDPLPTISINHYQTLQIRRDAHEDYDEHITTNNDGMGTQPTLIIEGDNADEEFAIPIGNPRREKPARPVWDLLLRRRRKQEIDERKVNVKTNFQALVRQMAPRKTITIDLEKAFLTGDSLDALQDELNETRSTRQEIHDIIVRQTTPVNLLDTLFEIIRQDTSTLLRVLDQILSDMEVDILDDTKMEDRLALWRQLINRAERELSELRASTKSFLCFFGITPPADTCSATADDNSDIIKNVSDLFEEIHQMLARLRTASSSLTSNMGLLESRRSIDEAHAVARLTELAFLFIPLSFASSIFGMEIEPFENPVPPWNFIVVAISVTTFAYLMRLTMRSQWLGNLKQSVKLDVRRYAEQHSLPVQVRSLSMLLLLQWFGSTLKRSIKATWVLIRRNGLKAGTEFWKVVGFPISFILVIGIVAVAPIAVLWTRNMDRGVQGAVTVVVMLAILSLVGIPYWRRSNPDFRYAFPRLVMRLLKRIPPTVRLVLLYALGIVAFVAIPLALIWTRPLASGIKAGLTAAILVILLTVVGFLGMTFSYSTAIFSRRTNALSEGTSISP